MRSEGESTQLMTRRLSLRTQLQASYSIYTKGDIAKNNRRTIDIQWESEQPLGMRMTISCKTIAGAGRLQRSLLSQANQRVGC
jgi:hypothetical protein